SFKRRGPEEEPVLIAIFFRQQGDFFVRLKTRNRELMGNNSRTRLELFQLRKQALQQRRRQVNRDHVRAAQIDRENVLVLNADELLKIVLLDAFSRGIDELQVDLIPD